MTPTDEMTTTKIYRLKGRVSLRKGTLETRVILGGPLGYDRIGLGGGRINPHELLSGISKLRNQRVASPDTLLPRVCTALPPTSVANQLPSLHDTKAHMGTQGTRGGSIN